MLQRPVVCLPGHGLHPDGTIFRAGPPERVITPAVIQAVYHTPVLVELHPVSGKPIY